VREVGLPCARMAAHYKHFSPPVKTFPHARAVSHAHRREFSRPGLNSARTGTLSPAPVRSHAHRQRFCAHRQAFARTGGDFVRTGADSRPHRLDSTPAPANFSPHRPGFSRTGTLHAAPASVVHVRLSIFARTARVHACIWRLTRALSRFARRARELQSRGWEFAGRV